MRQHHKIGGITFRAALIDYVNYEQFVEYVGTVCAQKHGVTSNKCHRDCFLQFNFGDSLQLQLTQNDYN